MNKIEIEFLFGQNRAKQLTFAYLVCQRVYANCMFFAEKFSLDYSLINTANETIYRQIFQNNATNGISLDKLIGDIF